MRRGNRRKIEEEELIKENSKYTNGEERRIGEEGVRGE
jgi:hypothetical protein